MVKNKLKKYTNHIIIFAICLFLIILSWFINAGVYKNGVFEDQGIVRAGIYDLFYLIYGTFSYCLTDIIFMFLVGALYMNLSKTYSYRLLVDKVADMIKGKEKLAFAIITLITGAYASITNEILILLLFVPFIVSVFLRCGKDRLTTLAAAFGGMFIGLLGTTFGTYGLTWFLLYTSVSVTKYLWIKVLVFAIAYILYVLFAFLHMDKHKKFNAGVIKYDMFYAEPLSEEESSRKYRRRHKVWPTVLVLVITLIFILLSYIDWEGSFKVKAFTKLFEFLGGNLKIKDVAIVGSVIGFINMPAMGTATDPTLATFSLVLAVIFVGIVNKISLANILDNSGEAVKKLLKVVLIYSLCYAPLLVVSYYPWAVSFIDKILGTSFNIFRELFGGFFGQALMVDQTFMGYLYGQYVSLSLADNMALSLILFKIGYGFALLIGPTSFVLMTGLSYLDVPYNKWLKYIWKFALSLFLAVVILFAVVVYM